MGFVLIVEPDKNTAKKMSDFLKSSKKEFEYEIADSAEQAITILEQKQVDVLISEMELPVISGEELFSMAGMIAPDAVRIVMSDGKKINETVSFLNACNAYKAIILPCRAREDFFEPIHAALEYKTMREHAKRRDRQMDETLLLSEEDYHRMEDNRKQNVMLYKQAKEAVMEMVHKNLLSDFSAPDSNEAFERYIEQLFDRYLSVVVNGNGHYLTCFNNLMNEFHHEKEEQIFRMKKVKEFDILSDKMNRITFLVGMIANACTYVLDKYKMAVLLEETEKYYVVRFACDYKNCTDAAGEIQFKEKNEKLRQDIFSLTETLVDVFVYRTVELKEKNQYILNCAIKK